MSTRQMCINTTRLCSTRVCICYYLAPPFRRRFTSGEAEAGAAAPHGTSAHTRPMCHRTRDMYSSALTTYRDLRRTPSSEDAHLSLWLPRLTGYSLLSIYTATDLRCRYESSYHSKSGDLRRLVTRCKVAQLMLKGPTVVHPRDWRGQLSTN